MGDDSPRAHALKHSDSHRSHKSRDSFATSELWALSRGPKTTSINPGHHIFPTLLVPADYSDPWRACATVYHTFTIPDCVAGKVIFARKLTA